MSRAVEYGAGEPLLTNDVVCAINAKTACGTNRIMVDVRHRKLAHLWLYVKGDAAGCALALDFYFQISPDGVNWHDLNTLSVSLSGAAVVVNKDTCVSLDLSDINYLRLNEVMNNETVAGRTATVNAWVSGK